MDVQELIALIPVWEQAQEEYLRTKDKSLHQRVAGGFDQLCEHYLQAPPQEREEIRQAFEGRRTLLNALLGHIYSAASRIESAEDSQWLLIGLAAASIEDQRTDYRDVYVALGEIFLAAVRAGIENSPHFKKVAALSSGKAKGGRNMRGFIGGFRRSAYFKESVAARVEFATGSPGLPADLPVITPDNTSQLRQLGGIGFPPRFVTQPKLWSPDGTVFAMAQGGAVELYAIESLQARPRILGGSTQLITGLAFDSTGQLLASSPGLSKSDIIVWDVASGTQQRIIQTPEPVYALAFSSRGTRLASGGNDRCIRMWNPVTGEPETVHEGQRFAISHLRFSLDDATLVACDRHATAYLWDVQRAVLRATLEGGTKRYVLSTSFNPESTVLVTSGRGPFVRLWDAHSGALIEEFDAGKGREVRDATFSPDGSILAVVGKGRQVMLWDYQTRKLLTSLKGHKAGTQQVTFNRVGTVLASASVTEGTVRFWGVNTAS